VGRPWEKGAAPGSLELARRRIPVFFEFCEKLGVPFYAWHDRDIAPHGPDAGGIEPELRRHGEAAGEASARQRRPAALGHRTELRAPALHARRGHQFATPMRSPSPPPR